MDKPYFFIAQIKVKDYADYHQRYGHKVLEQVVAAGGEILVASPAAEILEGEWFGNWTVIGRLPSQTIAKQWWNSPEYRQLAQLRQQVLSDGGSVVMVPGLPQQLLS
ncbi:DUF1330 domain-containing protein [Ferrimonas lipolytica]|uniref:DUF1330 domain-containing protein n=1 Tax=Ferrimonas lipolytica TaxID=2724191 RepID=A0A6H1UE85_9GAMM|nr:DUF1330 domain-containing protein [Ferrimonas lipolytica]QIZ76102.1 DUF1330 domain-containing protein [Ferrimonas lipolytica]